MKSLAIVSLTLLSGSMAANAMVQGNNNRGMLKVDAPSSDLANNRGIITIYGTDGNHNIPNNKGMIRFVAQRPVKKTENDDELLSILRSDDDFIGDDEFFAFGKSSFNMSGNKGQVHFNTDAPVSEMKNMHLAHNKGQITQTDSTGKTTLIEGGKTGSHPINTPITHSGSHKPSKNHHQHHLRSDKPIKSVKPTKPVETNNDEFFAFDKSSFDMSGNKGRVHFNTDTPVSQMENMNLAHNQGQITQTDSTGKTTLIEGGKKDVHPRNTTTTHPGSVHPGKNLHPHKPVKPVKPTKPVHTKPVETKPTMPGMNDMDADMNAMTLAMRKMEVDMQPLNELRNFLAK